MHSNETATGTGASAASPSIQRQVHFVPDGEWLRIVDPIERREDRVRTVSESDPSLVDTDTMGAPVDTAVSVTVANLSFDRLCIVIVRDLETGDVAQVAEGTDETFDMGRYRLEVSGPIKLYLEVTGSFAVRSDGDTQIVFDDPTGITLGARSTHQRPATTITVPADPEDMMRGISALGSALKTTSPERAWPTLRGHPPAIELGDELAVPRGVEPPVPEVEIAVPPTFQHVYVVAPLAYYLGGRVVPANSPRIQTPGGFELPLDQPRDFEAQVEHTLRQVLFLDCLVRSVGHYQFPFAEMRAVEDDLSLDYERLYDADPEVRLAEYMAVSYDTIEDQIPDWEVTSYVDVTPPQVEILPYLLNDLAVIKTNPDGTAGPRPSERAFDQAADICTVIRGASDEKDQLNPALPVRNGSLETNWAGHGIPHGGNKVTKKAFENQFETEPGDPPISATVVCNETEMDQEVDAVEDVYDPELPFPFEVDIRRDLTQHEFRRLLKQPTEFLHYVGHCEPAGLSCADGFLDIADLPEVDVESFLLNACSSDEQGLALIEKGAVGGVVTHGPILDSTATRVGPVIARMLNAGYSLRVALHLGEQTTISNQYLIVGNGGHSVVQSDGGSAVYDIDRIDENTFSVKIETYYSTADNVGGVIRPHLDQFDYHLIGNTTDRIEVPASKVEEWIWRGQHPVRAGDELRWNTLLSLDEI